MNQEPARPFRLSGLRLFQNPVVAKELRSRMRGSRAFLLLTLYLGAFSIILIFTYLIYQAAAGIPGNAGNRFIFGKVLFGITVWIELLTISFVAPALTAGAVAAEREHQTYDLLRTTLLPAGSLVVGKFISGMAYLLLLLFSALPMQSLAFWFGGVTLSEVLIASLILLVTAVFFCALGIFVSSLASRTLAATVIVYAVSILAFVGFPIIVWAVLAIGSRAITGNLETYSISQLMVLATLAWLVVSLNPLATTVATEFILLEGDSLILYNLPLGPDLTYPLISPWIPYTVFFLLFSLVLLLLSIRAIQRPET